MLNAVDSFSYFFLTSLMATVLMTILLWETRKPLVRPLAVLVTLVSVGASFLSVTLSLGTAKPSKLEMLKVEQANVLMAVAQEGVGIFVVLHYPGIVEPLYYKLPWDIGMAENLRKAQESLGKGQGMVMILPFEKSWDKRSHKFQPAPQPKMPDKPQDLEAPPVREFRT